MARKCGKRTGVPLKKTRESEEAREVKEVKEVQEQKGRPLSCADLLVWVTQKKA